MSKDVVLTNVDERGIASIIFNRPEVNNAYNSEMISKLISSVELLTADNDVRAIILRGNGKHFQAGADLNWLAESAILSEKDNIEISKRTTNAVRFLNECPKPTLALVHGACFGGGTGIIAACDIVIASANALFAISEVRWGLHAGPILPQLALAIGVRNLRRLALSGERFDAYEGKRIGLVHEVCDDGSLEASSNQFIDQILQNGPRALQDTKRIILETSGVLLDDTLANKLAYDHGMKRRTDEAREGLESYAERRDAKWYSPRQ